VKDAARNLIAFRHRDGGVYMILTVLIVVWLIGNVVCVVNAMIHRTVYEKNLATGPIRKIEIICPGFRLGGLFCDLIKMTFCSKWFISFCGWINSPV
jgi:hypothetical protein